MTSPRFRPATVRTNGRAHKWSKSKITVFHLFFSSCIFISLFSYINQMDRSFLNVVAPPDILETDQWHHIIIYTRTYRSHPAPQQWQQTYGASHSWPLRVNGCREVLCQRRIYINVIMLHYYVYYTRDIIIIIIIIIWWSLSLVYTTWYIGYYVKLGRDRAVTRHTCIIYRYRDESAVRNRKPSLISVYARPAAADLA
jgi:hypothetical protein